MHQMIPGPAGAVEANWAEADGSDLAVIAHPHPLYGGDMHNKVVHRLHTFYHARGCTTLRFNFRGVGASQGKSSGNLDEVQDLLAAIEWACDAMTGSITLHLAGFSFGAAMTAMVSEIRQPETMVLVAPPVGRIQMPQQLSADITTAVVVAGQDEVVPAEPVQEWLQQQPSCTSAIFIPEASHFFHGALVTLQQELDSWANSAWT